MVRTFEKLTFFFGVQSLLVTALLFAYAPQYVHTFFSLCSSCSFRLLPRWLHIAYTVQAAILLPLRIYYYKKRAWHYFLFDLCYYITILNFVFIWLAPSSATLWIVCYCMSHGSLASAVITWRNSLVFHDFDKVTSLFVHLYPPIVFTVILYVRYLVSSLL